MTLGILYIYIYKYIPKNAAASGFSQIKNHQLVMEKQDAEQQPWHGINSNIIPWETERATTAMQRNQQSRNRGISQLIRALTILAFSDCRQGSTHWQYCTVCLISCLSMLTPSINALLIKPLQMGQQQQQLDMSLIRLSPSADQINQCNFLINTIYFFHKVGQSRVSIISI